jgi:hypothetical protein
MKVLHFSLLFCIILLNGCSDDDADCPHRQLSSLTLEFSYTDDKGNDIFLDKIHKADVFIYNNGGLLVEKQSIDQASLSVFAGAKLNLSPGTYRVVCWGNANGNTSYAGTNLGNLFEDALAGYPTLSSGSVVTGGDPLYYAPAGAARSLPPVFTVTVPEQGSQTASISFCRAYIEIDVYVKGFEDQQLLPVIELTNIPAYYNFEMQTSGTLISYRNTSVYQTIDGTELATVSFYTPLFDEETSIQVLIKKQSDGSTVTTISLKDFIKDNNITISNTPDMVIPILVEYKQTNIEITVPGFGWTPVIPEL